MGRGGATGLTETADPAMANGCSPPFLPARKTAPHAHPSPTVMNTARSVADRRCVDEAEMCAEVGAKISRARLVRGRVPLEALRTLSTRTAAMLAFRINGGPMVYRARTGSRIRGVRSARNGRRTRQGRVGGNCVVSEV